MANHNQSGFALIPVIALVLVVGAIAVIALRVNSGNKVATVTSSSVKQSKAPADIKTTKDLQRASDSLSGSVDTSSLDADVASLL